jgi:hypothetical protein
MPVRRYNHFGAAKYLGNINNHPAMDISLGKIELGTAKYVGDIATLKFLERWFY